MGTSYDFTGRGNNKPASQTTEREKSQLWLNVGYSITVDAVDTTTGTKTPVTRFISLPFGIGIDTQAPFETSHIKDPGFRALQEARNALLKQLQEFGANLQPGEESPIKLELQLRRVEEPAEATPDGANPFMRAISFT